MNTYTQEDLVILEQQLEQCLSAYEKGNPLITDDKYDHFKRLLQKFKPDSAFLQKIGNKPKRNVEILPYVLGSLHNKFESDINSWLNKFNNYKGFILSHKLDGVAVECEYDENHLTNAWLRGDHYSGENVFHKIKHFAPDPNIKIIQNIGKFYMKAEILLNCEPSTIGYKTKRNAVAGILNRDDLQKLKYLYMIFHTLVPNDIIKQLGIKTECERLAFANLLFKNNIVRFNYAKTPDEVIPLAKNMIQEETQYDKDGIVVTYEDSEVENIKLPEKKIAFKFNKLSALSEVLKIEWNTSRTGKIIPVIIINPVDLGGATIQRATGFHAKFIYDNKVWPGATVEIVRSGDVIPYIERVVNPSNDSSCILDRCPSCGNTQLTADDVHIFCDNFNCPAQIQKRITHFFEKLGLENFSEKMITSLNCKSVLDIYSLTKEDILKIEGWADKSAEDFLLRIKQTKNTQPEKILSALGISNLGTSTTKLILENISINELINSIESDELLKPIIFKLVQIKGIGRKKIEAIIKGLKNNINLIKNLIKIGINFNSKPIGPLSGQSFCITGALSKPRKYFEQIIEKYGGTNSSITSCNYLICNAPSDSSKFKKALEKGVKIINENQLFEKLKL